MLLPEEVMAYSVTIRAGGGLVRWAVTGEQAANQAPATKSESMPAVHASCLETVMFLGCNAPGKLKRRLIDETAWAARA